MAVNVKMGVDIGGFTAGIKEGQQILKGLNAELKASEAEFKATGNAEQKMTSQTKTLTSQMNVQKGIADQARQALQRMTDAGINPADAAYQKMYITMMNAEAGMNEAQASLNALGQGAGNAAAQAEQLTGSLNGISKKISLDQVQSGIQKITTGLENAAKKAVELGEKLWSTIMDSASRADDTATMAEMYGIDLDTFQRMQKLVAGGMDTSVESMLNSLSKLKKGIGGDSDSFMSTMKELGLVVTEYGGKTAEGIDKLVTEDQMDLFFRAGQAIMNMGDAYDKEAAAQTLFGKSWKELVPMFNTYKTVDEYNEALEEQEVNSKETIRDLAALNDAVGKLEGSWTTLKDELIGAIAPALTEAATAAGGLLDKLTEYLKTDEGQAMLSQLGDAVSELLSGITELSADDVVNGFKDALNTLTSSLTWISENKDGLVTALEAIAVAFAGLKLADIAISIGKIVSGFQTLWGGAGNPLPTMPGGGDAAGTAAKGGFFSAAATKVSTAAKAFLSSGMLESMGVAAVALLPAILANAADQQHWTEQYNTRKEAAGQGGEHSWFIDAAADALDARSGRVDMGQQEKLLNGLKDLRNQQMAELINTIGTDTWQTLNKFWENPENFDMFEVDALMQDITDKFAAADTKVELPAELKAPDNAAESVTEQVGTVALPVRLIWDGKSWGAGGLGGSSLQRFANGTWSVPYDGMLARLHKGEMVMPAREIQSRSYSSNLYVESMIMNNGTDAEGLAAAMAAAQRRTMSGYGS